MQFKPGDICITDPEMAFDCLLVLSIENTGYQCISLKSQKYFWLRDDQMQKLGETMSTLDIAQAENLAKHMPVLPAIDDLRVLTGRARAKKELVSATGDDRARWQILADAKPGDTLTIHLSRRTEPVVFHFVVERGEKYVFLAEDRRNKLFRYTLEMLCPGNWHSKKT